MCCVLAQAIDLKDCDVYTYKSDNDTDPFGEKATVWAFNYFFYNRKMKRILYFSCRAVSKTAADDVEVIRGVGRDDNIGMGYCFLVVLGWW